jgi:hypothetical protein
VRVGLAAVTTATLLHVEKFNTVLTHSTRC